MNPIINSSELAHASALLDTGGPEAFYDYLGDRGFNYAKLAFGVASETSMTASAIGYLEKAALNAGIHLTEEQVTEIKLGMAKNYLDALKKIAEEDPDGNGAVTREITFDEAERFHRKLFEDHNLPSDSWIAKATYDMLTVEQREVYWKYCLDSAGNTVLELAFAGGTLVYMIEQRIANNDLQADKWLERMLSLPVGEMIAGMAIKDIAESAVGGLLQLRKLVELPGVSNYVLDRSLGMKVYDPLVLDLDGDGIETIAVQGGIKFDFDGDGIKTGTGWIASDDGILVFDRNGNSTIDNGSELFGVDTIKQDGQKALNGLDALQDLDSNGDGIFDASDSDFSKISVWQDIDRNGISEAGELKSLAELGIISIGLTGQPHNVDSNGNVLAAIGEFVRQDGSAGLVGSNIQNSYNINFATNNFESEFTEIIPENNDFADIPKIAGSGKVRNLHEASILDEQLAADVRNFMLKASEGKAAPLMDELLARWAFTSESKTVEERFELAGGLQTGFVLNVNDLDQPIGSTPDENFFSKLLILEKFLGNDLLTFTITTDGDAQTLVVGVYNREFYFYNNSSSTRTINAGELINAVVKQGVDQVYHQLFSDTYLSLTAHSLFDSYIQDMKIGVKDGSINYNFEDVAHALEFDGHDNPLKSIRVAIDLAAYYGDSDGTLTALIAKLAANMSDTELSQIGQLPVGIIFTDKLSGMSLVGFGQNIVIGGNQDLSIGKSGDDIISTWNTNDVIFGGTGNDNISSAGGQDTYVFTKDSGNDTLNVSFYDDNFNDKIVFSEMTTADVHSITMRGVLLEVAYGENSTLTIHGYFQPNTLQGGFVFSDGETWSKLDILKHAVIGGTDGDDSVYGFIEAFNDINTGAGDDTIWAGNLGSLIDAGAGNDVVFGGMADDQIYGGTGDDILHGNSGLDAFYFAKGDGHDTVLFNSNDSNFSDRIFLTDTQSTEPLSFVKFNNSLILKYSETDSVTLKDFFNSDGYLPEGIAFSDQVTWSREEILAKTVINGSDEDDQVWGFNGTFNTILAGNGDDYIYVGNSGSLVDAGQGNDTIYGGEGNDTLIGGKGDDSIYASNGIDTLYFSKGDGQDTVVLNNYDNDHTDRIVFTDIASTDAIVLESVNADLIIKYSDADSIIIKSFFNTESPFSGGFEFSDRIQWQRQDILAKTMIRGTEGSDQIWGFNGGFNSIVAGAGDDLIFVGNSGSRVEAGDGNDTVYDGVGDDILIGGAGDDFINLAYGQDIFFASKGDGHDTLALTYSDDNPNDRIVFTDIASTDEINVEVVNGQLIVKYGEADSITIKGFFSSDLAFSGGIEFSDQIKWSRQDILAKVMIRGTSGDDYIWGFNGGLNNIIASDGNDTIYVGNGGSQVEAGAGDDTIYDGVGNDVLIGGSGDDFINLSFGQDTLLAAKGDGHDTLTLSYSDDNPNDRIVFTDIASTDDISVELVNGQLIVKYGEDDSIAINGFFSTDVAFSGGIEFSDQIKWSRQDILAKVLIRGTPGDDQLWGFNGGFNNIIAGDGNDTIYVGNEGSQVDAGAGDDTIYDGVGNDALIGGHGDDFINLSFGQDIFIASKGDGHDTIKTSNYDDNVFDKIVFNDVLDTDIQSLLNIGSSLVFQYGDGDKITVKDFFSSDTILSGGLVFSDESAWSRQDVLEKTVIQGTPGDDSIWGYNQAKNTIFAGDGNDTIMAGSNGSEIFAQGGDDVIYGGAGNDLIIGGTGNDAIHGNGGADSYSFQLGDGQDTIFFDNWDNDPNDGVIFSGLTASQATFEKNANDLVIKYGDNDQVLIMNALSSEDSLLGGVKFDDVVMTRSDIDASINMYTAPELTILGQSPAHTDYL